VISDCRTAASRWIVRLGVAFSSLKVSITAGTIVALVLGIGLTTATLLQRAERDTLSAQNERELNEAVRAAGVLSRRVVDLQRALGVVAGQLDSATLADNGKLAAFTQAKPVLREMFSTVFAVAADGRTRVFSDERGIQHPQMNIADREYFRRTLSANRPVVSDPIQSRMSGEPVIVFTYPLKDSRGIYGILGGSLRLSSRDLLSDLVDAQNGDSDVLLLVTDAHGRILAHPNAARLSQELATEPRLAQAFRQWEIDGSPVEPAGLRLTQPGQVVSAAGVAGPDWLIWRATPEVDLLAPLRSARKQALQWAAGLIGVTSMVMWALLWWLLHPLTQLERRARDLFNADDAPHAGWPTGVGEIGQLARVLRHVGAERAQLEGFNTAVLGKLSSVMAAAPVGIAFTRGGRFELVSAELCRLFGRAEQALLGQQMQIIFGSNADYQALGLQLRPAFQVAGAYVGEWQMLRADGTLFWARLRGRPVGDTDADAGIIWTLNDIDQQIAERAQLEWSATHDVLTGLANRKALEQRLERVFAALPRSLPAAVVMMDLDHFKPINDTAGHAAGDAMLKAVAAAITSHVRTGDLIARLGGDEFALVLERCPQDVACRIAENVRSAIAAIALPWESGILRVGASAGVAGLTEQTRDTTAWLADADAACYRAKAEGRGAVRAAVQVPLRMIVGGRAVVES
jgi:diguanylate cyclase (GGDEF)-like protein/PAS domain S-box-containing protein